MKFRDLQTGNLLETNNAFVIRQYQSNPDKYEAVKPKATKNTETKKVDE